ncbi:MAG: LysR family transcriptional regulator [Pseudobdellovibrionaceae bacterium]
MSLSSLQLDAFVEVSKTQNFSVAASNLGLTQSALSQRILNLESDLQLTLFIREPRVARLTDAGEKLLRYVKQKNQLETEFLEGLKNSVQGELAGVLRFAGFSTITRSVLLPALERFISKNPRIQFDIQSKELRELPPMLLRGEVDYLLSTTPIQKQNVLSELIGHEENVLVHRKKGAFRKDVYLDHDSADTATEEFFRFQGKKIKNYQRSFLDDIYGILDGVKAGLGSAVVSRHLVDEDKEIEIVSGYKPLRVPIYLHFFEEPFYTQVQNQIMDHLRKQLPLYLKEK